MPPFQSPRPPVCVCVSLSGEGGVVCRGVCVYVRLGLCVCVRQGQRCVAVGEQVSGQQLVFCGVTAARIHAGLVSSDVVPVGGSGQDGGGGAGVGAGL